MIRLSFIITIAGLFLRLGVYAVASLADEQNRLSYCKGDTASISCGAGRVIIITSARYGGFPDLVNPCSREIDQECQEERDVIKDVQKVCFRKNSCSFPVDKTTLWDVCSSSQYLHLKLAYVCVAESSIHDLCAKLDRRITSGYLVSPDYPESAQKINTTKNCNVTMAMQSRHHVISFIPLDVRVPPGYSVRKCGMVLYINLRQNKNLDLICTEANKQVSLFGGEAAHVFTSVFDQTKGQLFALVHFQNNAMMVYELCRRNVVTSRKGIIVSPTVSQIDTGCAMDIKRNPDEEIVLKFVRKEFSEYVAVTKCDHQLIIANTNQFSPKLTEDCSPYQVSDIFAFRGHTQLIFVATSMDKVEIEYTVTSSPSDKSLENAEKPLENAEKPKKDWMIILVVCFSVFGAVLIAIGTVYWRRRSKKNTKPRVANGILHKSRDKVHTVAYTPPVWANKNSKDKDGFSTTKSRDSSMILPESQDRVWRDNPTCATSDVADATL